MSNVKPSSVTDSLAPELQETLRALNVTERDLIEAKEVAGRFTLDETKRVRGPELSGFMLGAY
jgi:hypothetical protein